MANVTIRVQKVQRTQLQNITKAVGPIWLAMTGVALAQDTLPACHTNLGRTGTMLTGQFNTVSAFRDGRSAGTPQLAENASGPRLTLFSDIRLGQSFTVFIPEDSPAGAAEIAFVGTQGRAPYRCAVDVLPIDAPFDDPSQIAFGQCDLERASGSSGAFGRKRNLITLVAGEVAVYTLPEPYLEGAVSPTRRLDYTVLYGANDVEFTAGEPGLATFFWLGRDDGDGTLKGLCPVMISQ